MKVKYIGKSDTREVSSADFPQTPDDQGWAVSWGPDEVCEVDDAIGMVLVTGMKNEFLDVTEYNTDVEEVDDSEEPTEEPVAEDGYWSIHKDQSTEDEVVDQVDEESVEEVVWLYGDELDAQNKTQLKKQASLRHLDFEGLTRPALIDMIKEHDLASDSAPEEA